MNVADSTPLLEEEKFVVLQLTMELVLIINDGPSNRILSCVEHICSVVLQVSLCIFCETFSWLLLSSRDGEVCPLPPPMTKFCCQPAPLTRFKLLTYCLRNPSFLQPKLQSISSSTIL